MKRSFRKWALLFVLLACSGICAADPGWPGWMGPNRDGVVEKSPPLLDAFGEGQPKVLWTSEEIIGGWSGGWGTVAVAGGRAYIFCNHKFDVPIPERVLSRQGLQGLGGVQGMPDDLGKKVEDARSGKERNDLKDRREIETWINKWLEENVPREQQRFRGAVQIRLRSGKDGLSPDDLAKLEKVVDRTFENDAALNAWFTESGFDESARKGITRVIPKTKPQARDYLICLGAGDGKTLWKTEVPGVPMSYCDSTTPCVDAGRVYALSSDGYVCCFDEKGGDLLWKTEGPKQRNWSRTRSSSVLVVDATAVVVTEAGTVALDVKDGRKVWEQQRLGNEGSSPTAWRKDGKTCVLVNGGSKLCLMELKTGNILWSVPGGMDGSPVVAQDVIVFSSGVKGGLIAYTATLEPPKELWKVPFADDYATPVVHEGHVYAIGGGKNGKALCIELRTGKVRWEAPVSQDTEYGSPVVADGKLIVVAGKELHLIRATPEKYELLGKADLGIEKWTSATFDDGRVFLRRAKAIICCDLRK